MSFADYKRIKDISEGVYLNEGINEIVLHYDTFGVTWCIIRKQGDGPRIIKEAVSEKPLAMNFRGDLSIIPFDIRQTQETTYGQYRFTSAPGLEKFIFSAFGKPEVWVDGKECSLKVTGNRADGCVTYEATVTTPNKRISTVAIRIEEAWGNAGGAAIDGPIRQICGEGLLTAGDWSQTEGISTYSGGAWYRKSIRLTDIRKGQKVCLNLGKVISTAEVRINGKKAGLKLTPPWEFDITDHVKVGDNEIEVLVHNTAANYYLSVPTIYRGDTTAGLLGTVSIEIIESE